MSLPTGPIQTPMAGFLSLLNLKNKGLLPDILQGSVQPTIDAADFYKRGSGIYATNLSRSLAAAAYNTISAISAATPLVVPANETWWVEHWTIRATAGGAGATVDEFSPAFLVTGGTLPGFVFPDRNLVSATKTSSTVSVRGVWLPPGATVGMWVGTVATNPISFDLLGFRYCPLRS